MLREIIMNSSRMIWLDVSMEATVEPNRTKPHFCERIEFYFEKLTNWIRNSIELQLNWNSLIIQTAFLMASMISFVSGNLRRRGGPFLRPDQINFALAVSSFLCNTEISKAPRRGGPCSLIRIPKFFPFNISATSVKRSFARRRYVVHDLHTSNETYASTLPDFDGVVFLTACTLTSSLAGSDNFFGVAIFSTLPFPMAFAFAAG